MVSAYLARRGMRVFAVDPVLPNIERLEETRCLNGMRQCLEQNVNIDCHNHSNWGQFTPHNFGILHAAGGDKTNLKTKISSLAKNMAATNLKLGGSLGSKEEMWSGLVSTVTVDDIISKMNDHIEVLHISAQESEWSVLQGTSHLISAGMVQNIIFMLYQNDASAQQQIAQSLKIKSFLQGFGFQFYNLDGCGRGPKDVDFGPPILLNEDEVVKYIKKKRYNGWHTMLLASKARKLSQMSALATKDKTPPKQDKSAAVFIFADTNSAKTYAPNINSFQCYVSRHPDYELVVMSEDDTEFSDGCINKDSKFVRHCMLSNYMLKHPEIKLFFHLDADHAIMDISRRIETFVSGEKDLTFEIRFHIGEITVGSYIAKNTEFSRSFLRELSHTESMRKDNEALQTLILKRVELKNSCPTTSDYFKFVKCFHETIRQSGCQHDFWTRHVDVLTPPHSFTYDGWLTKYQYSPKTFIHHAMKNPPIGGNNHGRIFPDVLENGCKMPDNDPYRISPEQEDHLLRERIDNIQSIWNANGLYNTSCIIFKDHPTSPATELRSTRVRGGR